MNKKLLIIICLSAMFALVFAACKFSPATTQPNPPSDDIETVAPDTTEQHKDETIPGASVEEDRTEPIEDEVTQENTESSENNDDKETTNDVEEILPTTPTTPVETEPAPSEPKPTTPPPTEPKPTEPKPTKPPHKHNYVKTVVAPTCSNKGYDLYKCEGCKDSYKENYVDKLTHEYTVETIAPTKDKKGYDLHTCSLCGDTYKDNYVDKVITYTEVNETVYAKSTVNIRRGPSTDYEKVGQLKEGDSITRIGIGDNGWSKVIYNDQEMYIHSDYLSKTKPVSNNYPLTYSDATCTITIEKKQFYKSWCYVAHLKFTDYDRFGSAIAKNKRGSYETTSAAAKRLGAIFCVNGPYNWGELSDAYAIVRSGKVFLDKGIHEDLAIYNAATGKLANAGQLGLSGKMASVALEEGLVTDTFKFWNSTLVKNGANVANPNNNDKAQRTFMATTGNPGEIYIVVSEGRYADGVSPGLTKYQCAKVILDLGCNYGVMLDGGGSSTMYFNGKVLNSAKGNQRAVVDFVYFK